MKIGPLEIKPAVTAPAERKVSATPAGGQPEASTQVDLSAAATGLSQAGTDPAFDTAKVERIAQAIRDGKFTINAEVIADKLIFNAEELLGRKLSS